MPIIIGLLNSVKWRKGIIALMGIFLLGYHGSRSENTNISGIGIIIFIMPDLITQSAPGWDVINKLAEKHNIPIVAVFHNQIYKGALFHYGLDYTQVGKTAATLADKTLRGTSPGSIPVASPNMNLHINYRRAQKLGLTVPEGLLKQAYQVIR